MFFFFCISEFVSDLFSPYCSCFGMYFSLDPGHRTQARGEGDPGKCFPANCGPGEGGLEEGGPRQFHACSSFSRPQFLPVFFALWRSSCGNYWALKMHVWSSLGHGALELTFFREEGRPPSLLPEKKNRLTCFIGVGGGGGKGEGGRERGLPHVCEFRGPGTGTDICFHEKEGRGELFKS